MTITDHLLLADGAMLVTTDTGDVRVELEPAAGLYVRDTRLLSTWRLRVGGADVRVGAAEVQASRRRVLLLPDSLRNRPDAVAVEREQRLDGAGFTERLRVRNTTAEPTRRIVELTANVDFADQFQVRTDGRFFDRSSGRRSVRPLPNGVEFEWSREKNGTTFAASSRITTSVPADQRVNDDGVRFAWDLELPAHTTILLRLRVGGPERHKSPGPTLRIPPPVADPAAAAVLSCSRADLESLLIDAPDLPSERVPAAGAPWFLTLFGRDALLTSVLAGSDLHDFRPAVLRALAVTQGRRADPVTLEQPGRIVHEVRSGELAVLGDVPYRRYYGSVDVTALFLAVLGRTALGPDAAPDGHALAVELRDSALAAIEWLRTDGGLADRGFVTYSPDPDGLLNQGWKDSSDSTTFADGRLADGPIALAEVQGYTWDALRRSADLAAECWGLPKLAADLAAEAAGLRARFLDQFWLAGKSFPAMALDGSSRPVDGLGSNAGHLLWSGILPERQAHLVTGRLLAEEFWTGWGIRTLAADQHRYSPLSYHNGSVWPHDSMIAALGMLAYGFHRQARNIARGVVDCGAAAGGRLPELVGGFHRSDYQQPVTYRFAGSPQAWSAAAGLAAVRVAGQATHPTPVSG